MIWPAELIALLILAIDLDMLECLQKLCIMDSERALLEYEKKDLEKRISDQTSDSDVLRAQLRVCINSVFDIFWHQ